MRSFKAAIRFRSSSAVPCCLNTCVVIQINAWQRNRFRQVLTILRYLPVERLLTELRAAAERQRR